MFKINRIVITKDNAHRLLKERKITAEEYAEFIMNFLYETTLDEETRSKIRISKVQDNGSEYEDIPVTEASKNKLRLMLIVGKII